MPTARFTTVFAANEVVPNVMAGSQFEFMGRPTRVQVYGVVDATEAVSAEIFFGQELQLGQSPLPEAVAGTGPVVPDDLLVDDIAAGGDRLTVRLTEVGGAAGNTRVMVVLTPVM